MKKIQLLFVLLAVLTAGAGVYANARATLAITYWRTADNMPNTQGANCDEPLDVSPCQDVSGEQCFHGYLTVVDGVPATRTYFISKKDSSRPNPNECLTVKRL